MSLAPATERYVSRYTDLAKAVRDAGLLRRNHLYYWTEMGVAVAAFAGIWVGFAFLGDSWFQLLLAAALGIVVTQFGFLGHDAAHRQMFESAVWNTWTARILAGAFAGLSFSWWRTKHNLHHKGPNRDRFDPDIAPGAISFTPDVVDARMDSPDGWRTDRAGSSSRYSPSRASTCTSPACVRRSTGRPTLLGDIWSWV